MNVLFVSTVEMNILELICGLSTIIINHNLVDVNLMALVQLIVVCLVYFFIFYKR